MYFTTFSRTNPLYTSIDGGATLIARNSVPGGYWVEEIKTHPTLPEWALARCMLPVITTIYFFQSLLLVALKLVEFVTKM